MLYEVRELSTDAMTTWGYDAHDHRIVEEFDDMVVLRLDTDNEGVNNYSLYMTTDGDDIDLTTYDGLGYDWEVVDPWTRWSWNRFYRPSPANTTWYMEVKIPFSSLVDMSAAPAEGTAWGIGLKMFDGTGANTGVGSWSHQGMSDEPPWYGEMTFGPLAP